MGKLHSDPMKVQELFPKKLRQQEKARAAEHSFTEHQVLANMELLKQELSGLEQGANSFFRGFSVPPVKGKPAQWRAWLLQGEDIGDLTPVQVDYVLKNLAWFKEQIAKVQEKFNDDLP